ncbi:hypothetical protein LWI28_001052 [Acer negundo]|uniref:Uncharacterized protein n=1 Tax=Acer negundo TaxID=4023 RepID=A0AAD5JKX2_ACENE|nr:hypothetical protein LWI28_001052 [Acer negundo]
MSTPPSAFPALIPPCPILSTMLANAAKARGSLVVQDPSAAIGVQRKEFVPLLPREPDLPTINPTVMIEVVPDSHIAPKFQRQDLTQETEVIPEEDTVRGPKIPGAGVSQASTGGRSVILVNLSEEAKAKSDIDSALVF